MLQSYKNNRKTPIVPYRKPCFTGKEKIHYIIDEKTSCFDRVNLYKWMPRHRDAGFRHLCRDDFIAWSVEGGAYVFFENVVEGVSINLKELIDKFCDGHCCSIIKTPPNLRHVFQEICEVRDTAPMGYLRLKVLESLFLLSQMLPQENFETAAYYSANQIKKIKVLKCELANQLDSRETLKSIADRYGMSLTALKDCFKAVYGKPIHAFQREYKMQAATQLLVTTKMSIAEIAGMVGYENPNKFSTAFKEIIGQSPSEYRKSRN